MLNSVEPKAVCFGRRAPMHLRPPRSGFARAGAARSQPSRREPGARLAGLDLLRLAAALAVVLFHYGYRATAGDALGQTAFPEFAGVAKYGFLGVDLFFVISGFVIAASAQGRGVIQFAIARIGRLYPAFLVAMSLTALVLAVYGSSPLRASLPQWAANLTMVSPAFGQPFMDGAYWSIVLEIVFYGWIAILIAAGLFERRLLEIIAIWLAVSVLNEFVLHLKPLRYILLTEYAPMFASGMLIHAIVRNHRVGIAWPLLAVAFVLGARHAYEVQAVFARLYGDTIDIRMLWALHAGIYAAFWASLAWSRTLTPTPLVLALGGLTYPLYLLHQNAGYVTIDQLAPAIGRWPALVVTTAAMLAVAWLIWRFVEPVGRQIIGSVLKGLAGRLLAEPQPARA